MKLFYVVLFVITLTGCTCLDFYEHSSGNFVYGQKVYSIDECIDAAISGVYHGGILPNAGYHKTCYGTIIFGECTGPMF